MTDQTSNHGSECFTMTYPDAPAEVVCFCAVPVAADLDVAVLSATLDRPRNAPRTSSGWCEACEDGAINLCTRGGCY